MESAQDLIERKGREALEWGELITALKERTRTPVGKSALDAWDETKILNSEAEEMARGILELRALKSEIEQMPPINDYRNLTEILGRISRAGLITVAEFRDLITAQEIAQALYQYLRKHGIGKTSLLNSLLGLDLLEKWAQKHRNLLDRNGEIADFASPDLGALRSLARELHEKVKNRLTEYLQSSRYAEYLQDFYVTLRDGRYVLPVRSNFKGRMPGIIHDISHSEATLFIEPQDIVEWNNQLVVTEKEIRIEIDRILTQVVMDTQPYLPAFERNQEIIQKTDVMGALVELYDSVGAEATVAQYGDDLSFEDLGHPLLATQRKMVLNTFDFKQGLILTGPNTGGKTVLLKSLGLAILMAKAGFPVFARRATLRKDLGTVTAVIGDDQNLAKNLSTFSAHLLVLKSLFDNLKPGDLALIDEIASGTSPEEAQPLAQAVIEELLNRGVHLFVTTHFGALKKFALAEERLRIAAMNFDSETKRPSYEIIMDIPGESSAFDTAEQYGLPMSVLDRARSLRGEDSKDLSLALREIERIRKTYKSKEDELQAKIDKAAEREQKAQKTIEEFGLQSHKKLMEETQKFLKDFQDSKDKLMALVQVAIDKPAELSVEDRESLKNDLEKAQNDIRASLSKKALKSIDRVSMSEKEIAIGTLVEVEGIGIGEIVEMPKASPVVDPSAIFVVSVGGLKTRVQRSRLILPDPEQGRLYKSNLASLEAKREKKTTLQPVGGGRSSSAQSSKICDVRGIQLEEAVRRVETAVNGLVSNGGSVTVIHGIGTGRLRDGLRKHLSARSDLKFRPGNWPGEGDDGVTLIERDE